MSGSKKDWFRPVTVQLKHVTWIQWTATEERLKMDATGTGGPVRLGPGLFPVHTTGPQNTSDPQITVPIRTITKTPKSGMAWLT